MTDAEIFTVCPSGCDYTIIADGINNASPGDTVKVHSGTYKENLEIKKPVILNGIDTGNGRPIVDASGNQSGIIIAANGITLTGFEISHSRGSWFDLWAGILVASNDSIIADNLLVDNENGILIIGSSNNTLDGNLGINNDNGIKLVNTRKNIINNNIISHNFYNLSDETYGLLLVNSHNNMVLNNKIAGNYCGLLLNSSADNELRNNSMNGNGCNFGAERYNDIDESNIADNKSIYFLNGVSDVEFDNLSNAGTVYCFDCRNITLKGLTLKNNLHGIYFCNTTLSTVENNMLVNNSYGLRMDESNDNSVIENKIVGNRIDGISLYASGGNDIESNIAKNNSKSGISLVGSSENNINNNSASINFNGIELDRSIENKIAYNNLSANKNNGILVYKSGYNDIHSNNLGHNPIGLALEISWNNSVVGNLIDNNTRGLQIISSHYNDISNNNISDNKIALSRDFSSNIMLQHIALIGKINEELIIPEQTKSGPNSFIMPVPVNIEILSYPAGAKVIMMNDNKKVVLEEVANLTTEVLEDNYYLDLIWKKDTFKDRVYIDKLFKDYYKSTKKGSNLIIRRINAN